MLNYGIILSDLNPRSLEELDWNIQYLLWVCTYTPIYFLSRIASFNGFVNFSSICFLITHSTLPNTVSKYGLDLKLVYIQRNAGIFVGLVLHENAFRCMLRDRSIWIISCFLETSLCIRASDLPCNNLKDHWATINSMRVVHPFITSVVLVVMKLYELAR